MQMLAGFGRVAHGFTLGEPFHFDMNMSKYRKGYFGKVSNGLELECVPFLKGVQKNEYEYLNEKID